MFIFNAGPAGGLYAPKADEATLRLGEHIFTLSCQLRELVVGYNRQAIQQLESPHPANAPVRVSVDVGTINLPNEQIIDIAAKSLNLPAESFSIAGTQLAMQAKPNSPLIVTDASNPVSLPPGSRPDLTEEVKTIKKEGIKSPADMELALEAFMTHLGSEVVGMNLTAEQAKEYVLGAMELAKSYIQGAAAEKYELVVDGNGHVRPAAALTGPEMGQIAGTRQAQDIRQEVQVVQAQAPQQAGEVVQQRNEVVQAGQEPRWMQNLKVAEGNPDVRFGSIQTEGVKLDVTMGPLEDFGIIAEKEGEKLSVMQTFDYNILFVVAATSGTYYEQSRDGSIYPIGGLKADGVVIHNTRQEAIENPSDPRYPIFHPGAMVVGWDPPSLKDLTALNLKERADGDPKWAGIPKLSASDMETLKKNGHLVKTGPGGPAGCYEFRLGVADDGQTKVRIYKLSAHSTASSKWTSIFYMDQNGQAGIRRSETTSADERQAWPTWIEVGRTLIADGRVVAENSKGGEQIRMVIAVTNDNQILLVKTDTKKYDMEEFVNSLMALGNIRYAAQLDGSNAAQMIAQTGDRVVDDTTSRAVANVFVFEKKKSPAINETAGR